jgi:hypothetical protein
MLTSFATGCRWQHDLPFISGSIAVTDTSHTQKQHTLLTGPELFRFGDFNDWVDNYQQRFEHWRTTGGVPHTRIVCLDATGRLCSLSRDFIAARERDAFPVVAYHIDTNWQHS